jgi:hypothetical protein
MPKRAGASPTSGMGAVGIPERRLQRGAAIDVEDCALPIPIAPDVPTQPDDIGQRQPLCGKLGGILKREVSIVLVLLKQLIR